MNIADNKILTFLAFSNVIAFIIIFILFWLLWSDSGDELPADEHTQVISTQSETSDKPVSTPQNKSPANPVASIKQKTVSIVAAVVQEMKDTDLIADIQPDSGQEPETSPPRTVSGSLTDREYIESFKQLESDTADDEITISEEDITTVKAKTKAADQQETNSNNFNKIDVSQINNKNGNSLVARVEAVVSSNGNTDDDPERSPAWRDYLATLKVAEKERKNEMRTIKVKKGETLWRISLRAYGSGFQYKKIFRANPHLKSPDSILAGEILRVPL